MSARSRRRRRLAKDIAILARGVAREIAADAQGTNWRDAILTKGVYLVPKADRPVPDGLSRAYIELAARMHARPRRATPWTRARTLLIADLETMLQTEIARARLAEDELLALAEPRR